MAVFATLMYDVISATNSSPQTTEINARTRAETLMKWVHLGLAQGALFVVLGAAIEARAGRPWAMPPRCCTASTCMPVTPASPLPSPVRSRRRWHRGGARHDRYRNGPHPRRILRRPVRVLPHPRLRRDIHQPGAYVVAGLHGAGYFPVRQGRRRGRVMGGLILAWMAGESIVVYRWAKLKAPPTPGALAWPGVLFVGLAVIGEYAPARTAVTLAAWGLDLA